MLEGIRVIDFTQNLPGPFASMRLAEMGAEVIKVEPFSGDPARHAGEKKDGVGLLFLSNNRHKKSIALDLKTEEGKEIAIRLIRQADVLIESFRPSVMIRLGLGYEELSSLHPTIIYASITGYGENGVLSNLASHDLNYMALSGALSQLRDNEDKFVHPTLLIADLVSGISLSEAILAALVQRGIKQCGTYLNISILNEMLRLMDTHVTIASETGNLHGTDLLAGESIAYGLYSSKDHRTVALAALEPKFWKNFCTAVKRTDWISAQYTPQTDENPFYVELRQLFKSRTWREWLEFALKVDGCLTPVMEAGEWENLFPHSYNSLYKRRNDNLSTTVPLLIGQHTEEILTGWFQATPSQIESWRNQKIIR